VYCRGYLLTFSLTFQATCFFILLTVEGATLNLLAVFLTVIILLLNIPYGGKILNLTKGEIMEDCCEPKHPDYSKLIPRINRAIGQLGGIKKMIEERRYCPEIIMQLRAVGSACQSIEIIMLQKHLESCVTQAFESNDINSQKEKIRELTNLYKGKIGTYASNEIHE